MSGRCRRLETQERLSESARRFRSCQCTLHQLWRDGNRLARLCEKLGYRSCHRFESPGPRPCRLLLEGSSSAGKSSVANLVLRTPAHQKWRPSPEAAGVCTRRAVRLHFSSQPRLGLVNTHNREFACFYQFEDVCDTEDEAEDVDEEEEEEERRQGQQNSLEAACIAKAYEKIRNPPPNAHYKVNVGLNHPLLECGLEIIDPPGANVLLGDVGQCDYIDHFLATYHPAVCLYLFHPDGSPDKEWAQLEALMKVLEPQNCRFVLAAVVDRESLMNNVTSLDDEKRIRQLIERRPSAFENVRVVSKLLPVSPQSVSDHVLNGHHTPYHAQARLLSWIRLEESLAEAIEASGTDDVRRSSSLLLQRLNALRKGVSDYIADQRNRASAHKEVSTILKNMRKTLYGHVSFQLRCPPPIIHRSDLNELISSSPLALIKETRFLPLVSLNLPSIALQSVLMMCAFLIEHLTIYYNRLLLERTTFSLHEKFERFGCQLQAHLPSEVFADFPVQATNEAKERSESPLQRIFESIHQNRICRIVSDAVISETRSYLSASLSTNISATIYGEITTKTEKDFATATDSQVTTKDAHTMTGDDCDSSTEIQSKAASSTAYSSTNDRTSASDDLTSMNEDSMIVNVDSAMTEDGNRDDFTAPNDDHMKTNGSSRSTIETGDRATTQEEEAIDHTATSDDSTTSETCHSTPKDDRMTSNGNQTMTEVTHQRAVGDFTDLASKDDHTMTNGDTATNEDSLTSTSDDHATTQEAHEVTMNGDQVSTDDDVTLTNGNHDGQQEIFALSIGDHTAASDNRARIDGEENPTDDHPAQFNEDHLTGADIVQEATQLAHTTPKHVQTTNDEQMQSKDSQWKSDYAILLDEILSLVQDEVSKTLPARLKTQSISNVESLRECLETFNMTPDVTVRFVSRENGFQSPVDVMAHILCERMKISEQSLKGARSSSLEEQAPTNGDHMAAIDDDLLPTDAEQTAAFVIPGLTNDEKSTRLKTDGDYAKLLDEVLSFVHDKGPQSLPSRLETLCSTKVKNFRKRLEKYGLTSDIIKRLLVARVISERLITNELPIEAFKGILRAPSLKIVSTLGDRDLTVVDDQSTTGDDVAAVNFDHTNPAQTAKRSIGVQARPDYVILLDNCLSAVQRTISKTLPSKVEELFSANIADYIESLLQRLESYEATPEDVKRLVNLESRLLPSIDFLRARILSLAWEANEPPLVVIQGVRTRSFERRPRQPVAFAANLMVIRELTNSLIAQHRPLPFVPLLQWLWQPQEGHFLLYKPKAGPEVFSRLSRHSTKLRLRLAADLASGAVTLLSHGASLQGLRPQHLFFDISRERLLIDLEPLGNLVPREEFAPMAIGSEQLPPFHLRPERLEGSCDEHNAVCDLAAISAFVWVLLWGENFAREIPTSVREAASGRELAKALREWTMPVPTGSQFKSLLMKLAAFRNLEISATSLAKLYLRILANELEEIHRRE